MTVSGSDQFLSCVDVNLAHGCSLEKKEMRFQPTFFFFFASDLNYIQNSFQAQAIEHTGNVKRPSDRKCIW